MMRLSTQEAPVARPAAPNCFGRDSDHDWFALPVTRGLEPFQLLSLLEAGQAFSGFRFPSRDEFNAAATFFTPVPPPLNDFCDTCDFAKTLEFIQLFEAGQPRTSFRAWLDLTVLDPAEPLFAANAINIFGNADARTVEFDSQRVEANQIAPLPYLLVRPIPVLEPSPAAVLVAGLLAFSLLRRPRSAAT